MTDSAPVRFLDRTTPPHIATLVLLTGTASMSMTMFLPSLPNMASWFQAEYWIVQLSVSLYLAVNGLLQIVVGPISDRYGRRPVILASLVLFVLATLGTLAAPTIELFLFFRMCQSVVVAALVLSRAAVRDMHGPERAASMIGYVTMGMALVPMIAPMVGGALDAMFGWQASFVFMLVFALAVLALSWSDLGETATNRPASFRAQFAQYPELLSSRRFWGYCAAAAFASGVFFAFLGGAPFVGAQVYGLSAAALGVYFGFPAVGYALGNFLSGRYSVRLGINRMVFYGAAICLGGLLAMGASILSGLNHPAVFFGFFFFTGIGNGMLLPNATSGMLSVRPRLAGSASGLGGAITIGGGAALSALAGALLVPGSGPWPLLVIMIATAFASLLSILYVMWRERTLGL
ncbi:multidrug effflux MFS transporter [Alkalilacustris brevis]|uniref:multidrug effflux MFS transporter n=1 Tax=Alkalilacustris brevis TaxID=2026338 RepID=UPI000E0D89E0|nr:multidrug effflux MFS transporter [Alkalilacustris brevis]